MGHGNGNGHSNGNGSKKTWVLYELSFMCPHCGELSTVAGGSLESIRKGAQCKCTHCGVMVPFDKKL